MGMLFRILTVRKHKTVTFCEAYSFELFRRQIMISNELLYDTCLTVGTVIEVKWHMDINRSGKQIVFIDTIENIYTSSKNMSYKSYNFVESNIELDDSLSNELNGGVHLLRWRFYIELIGFIQNDLSNMGIVQVSTPILTKYRGTSIVNPACVTGNYLGKQYIKITHELELKKRVYMSLVPVFELGYVVRDRYITKTGRNEFYTLEGVVPKGHQFELKDFYIRVLREAQNLAGKFSLKYNSLFDRLVVIDVLSEYKKEESFFSKSRFMEFYELLSKKHNHVIFVNAPMDSPLGWMGDLGVPMETQWNLNGHGLGHGYLDEYRVDYLLNEFYQQQRLLAEKGIDASLPEDYLRYCEYGAIPTYSFNLGVERFFEFFFELDGNINENSNE